MSRDHKTTQKKCALTSLRPRQMEYNVGIRSRSQIKIELDLYLVRQRPLFRVINTFFWEVYCPIVWRMGWIIKRKRQKDQLESDSSNCLASRKHGCLNLENSSGKRKKETKIYNSSCSHKNDYWNGQIYHGLINKGIK